MSLRKTLANMLRHTRAENLFNLAAFEAFSQARD